jgi:HK97 family phage major capsid protein
MATIGTSPFEIPEELVPGVWRKAQDGSVLAKLSKSEPQKFGVKQYIKLTGTPRAEVVGESVDKSQSNAAFAPIRSVQRKLQVTQRFSQELKWADEDEQIGALQTMADLSGEALARGLDLVAIHGMNPLTGAAIAGSPVKLLDTTNVVELTTATAATPDAAIEAAYALLLADSATPDGIGFDPSYAFTLATQRDTHDGKRLYPELGLGKFDNFLGFNAASSNTVSGGPEALTASTGIYESVNPGIKAIVGDFTAFKWGVQRSIGVTMIEYGDPDGDGDLQRANEIALRAEVVYGIGFIDLDSFAVIKDAIANS